MTADVVEIDEAVTGDRPRTAETTRYRLDVIGADVPDVVAFAGGWLFDRVMAGWEVTVAVPRLLDAAPLRILGVHTAALGALLDGGRTCALAVSGSLCHADGRVREAVGAALRSARAEVMVWGDDSAFVPGGRGAAVRHELSSAAGVFKAHALAAAGTPAAPVSGVEAFTSLGRPAPTAHPDLLPG